MGFFRYIFSILKEAKAYLTKIKLQCDLIVDIVFMNAGIHKVDCDKINKKIKSCIQCQI